MIEPSRITIEITGCSRRQTKRSAGRVVDEFRRVALAAPLPARISSGSNAAAASQHTATAGLVARQHCLLDDRHAQPASAECQRRRRARRTRANHCYIELDDIFRKKGSSGCGESPKLL